MKRVISNSIKRLLPRKGVANNFIPDIGLIRFGDFFRTAPFSRRYGIDRGGALDRYYIENFLHENRAAIKGRVLEVANNDYTIRFGEAQVTQSDILHVDKQNQRATLIADLGEPLEMEGELFDCIILTQTLQFIYNTEKAIENCYKLLKPGGILLLTVPGITPLGKDPFDWYWSFTTFSVRKLLSQYFSVENTVVNAYGNVLVASAFLYGVGIGEIGNKEMDVKDPSFQVIISVAAKK